MASGFCLLWCSEASLGEKLISESLSCRRWRPLLGFITACGTLWLRSCDENWFSSQRLSSWKCCSLLLSVWLKDTSFDCWGNLYEAPHSETVSDMNTREVPDPSPTWNRKMILFPRLLCLKQSSLLQTAMCKAANRKSAAAASAATTLAAGWENQLTQCSSLLLNFQKWHNLFGLQREKLTFTSFPMSRFHKIPYIFIIGYLWHILM